MQLQYETNTKSCKFTHSAITDLVDSSETDVWTLNLKAESVYKHLKCKTSEADASSSALQKNMRGIRLQQRGSMKELLSTGIGGLVGQPNLCLTSI